MTSKTWRQRWLEPLTHLLRGETSPGRHAARRRIVPLLEQLESRLAPATTFSIADNSVIEPAPNGTVNLDFTVTRSGDLTSQVTLGYTTVAGTAKANTDFTPTTGTVLFPKGATTETISIPIFGNGVFNNPSLTFSVQLTGVTNIVGPPVTLADHSDFATGTNPFSVAVADFNGDGKPDLAVANGGDNANSVSVLLNTTAPGAAAPTFAPNADFATGTFSTSVAVADLNGDGKPDLVVANGGSDSVSVLLNTTTPGAATPTFAAHGDFFTGTRPYSVAVGDFNGDGKPDLAVANQGLGANSVSVLLNMTATGAAAPTFASKADFGAGLGPVAVAVGDLNGDGKPDLAVANFRYGANSVSVLLNTTAPGAAAPSFAPKMDFAVGSFPTSVAIADLNGDGKPDLVVANGGSNSVSVLLNTTAPGAAVLTFAPKADFAAGTYPRSVTIGDLNGDGKPDLAIANLQSNSVSVLLNTTAPGAAAPTFTPKADFAAGTFPHSVIVADLNGDGKLDLAVANEANRAGGNSVSVLENTTVLGAATILPDFPIAAAPAVASLPISVAVGDLNGDGKPDLAIANLQSNSVSVLLNTTAPGAAVSTFAPRVDFTTGPGPVSVTIADLNGDGKLDLVVVNGGSNGVSVLLNTTSAGAITPTFAPKLDFAVGSFPTSVAIADFNGDGKPDLVVTASDSNTVSVLLNTTAPGAPAPSFAPKVDFVTGNSPFFVAVADLNGDGKPDLAVANFSDNTVSVLLNTTPPGAAAPAFATHVDFAAGNSPFSVAVGDLNGDGKPDLVVANAVANSVSVLLNTTAPGAIAPTFAAKMDFAVGRRPLSVAVVDLNGDGKPDLVVANQIDNTVSVLLNTTAPGAAAVSLAPKKDFAVGTNPRSVAIADLNGDGRPDFAVANQNDNTVSVLLNTPEMITRTATGTIIESDPEPTVQFANASQSVNENDGTFTVTVTLSAVSGSDATIPFTLGGTAVSGTDYSGVTVSPLVIKAGGISGQITGTLLDDGKFNTTNKTLTFTLGNPTNAALTAPTTDTLTINESDPKPTVSFASATQSVNENAGTFSVPLILSAASSVDTTVPFTLTGPTFSVNGSAVITAGQTTGAVTGTLTDDGKFSTTNTMLTLTLGAPTNATLGATATNTLTVVESDPKPMVSFASAMQTVNENGGTFTVTVNLSAASSVDTTVPFTLGGTATTGTDYSGVTANPLVIKAGQISGTITGALLDDGAPDAVKTLTLTLGSPTNATLGATTTDALTIADALPTPPPVQPSLPPSVSVAFGPAGEVVEVVNSAGVLTQFDATGAHQLGNGGVRSASVAFGPFGEVLEVVGLNGILTQFDSTGAHQLGGAGVESACIAFGPGGQVLEIVLTDGSLRQFSAAGVQVLGTSGVVSASVAFGPGGEVLDVLSSAGVLIQFDSAGAHLLDGGNARSASVAFAPFGEVVDIIFSDGTLDQFDAFGVHRLGVIF